MAKGRWEKYSKINGYILEILKTSNHLTTNEVKRRLKSRFNIVVSWVMVKKYLAEIGDLGHIERYEVQKRNKVVMWKAKQD